MLMVFVGEERVGIPGEAYLIFLHNKTGVKKFSSVQDMVGIKVCYYEFMCGESIIVDSGMVFV